MDRDLRLVAQVTWVGRSSLEVAAEALLLDPSTDAWEPCLTARFVVVRSSYNQSCMVGEPRTTQMRCGCAVFITRTRKLSEPPQRGWSGDTCQAACLISSTTQTDHDYLSYGNQSDAHRCPLSTCIGRSKLSTTNK